MKIQSVMNHNFSQVPKADIPRSKFDRSHGLKTTFNAGDIVPIFVDEALPGDTFNLNASFFARLATPIVPIMDNIKLDVFYFAVPYRLVWDNWEKFNGQQTNPGDSTDYLIPQMVAPGGGYGVGSLQDYLGIPTGVPALSHSSLPLRAYNLIYNEWFRDENLINSLIVPKGDGPDTYTGFQIRRRGKRHDYFTSALPWPQKGPAVELPLGSSAPVVRDAGDPVITWLQQGSSTEYTMLLGANASTTQRVQVSPNPVSTVPAEWGNSGLVADLSDATAATINSLRQAFQIQKLYERDARGGTRYTEIIRSHFGVVSPDARLQRPEYLGGGTFSVNVSPIAQTSSTDATTPQGNLAAMGVASSTGTGFVKSFTEHCILLGFVSARADLNYQQGLNKMWSRRTRWDFYWPALSHLGEQAVLNKEIYAQGSAAPGVDDQVFGYQERFAEYRYKPSQITGQFRSQAAQSLDIWHLAQEFVGLPALNDAFIYENPPIARVIATENYPEFLLDSFINLQCARPMPTYSVPGLIDHF